MQRKSVFVALAVALLAVTLFFAARWQRRGTPPEMEPAAVQSTSPVNTTRPTESVFWRAQPGGSSATYVPTPFPEPSVKVGAIRGRVVDDKNRPVAGARVEAMGPMGGLTQTASTNHWGWFTITDVDISNYKTYTLIATKEVAGYGHPFNRFYSEGFVKGPVEVTVSENQTVSCGDLHLGPRTGRLIGTIRDAKTRELIKVTPEVEMVLRRADNPKLRNSSGLDIYGKFKFLVPPVPFMVELSAPGYENKTLGPLSLKSGEIKRLDILLTPAK